MNLSFKNPVSRFWVPGPDAGFLGNLRYARGFLQIQDLIDKSIMRNMENILGLSSKVDEIGVYTKEFPYPCFVREK